MQKNDFANNVWPIPADRDASQRLRSRFMALGAPEKRIAHRANFGALLDSIGGNSPYLSDLALREARLMRCLAAFGPDRAWQMVLDDIAAITPDQSRERVAAWMRQAKRRGALLIGLADLGGAWSLEKVTQGLSLLAENLLRAALAHLLHCTQERDELRLPDPASPETDCGFVILGMGKLGAHELNYSSDVDLILLYDPEAHAYHADQLPAIFTRLARNLVQLMEARDADGYVFRTDLRLRPNPGATPPAISLPAALTYYESMGQGWERAAMIKARPLAGDLPLGCRFLREIKPFVWRQQLDFSAIADLRQMKQRIDAHKSTKLTESGSVLSQIAGHNVKLGQGGIREVEFVVQTFQLIWGGRDPDLRDSRTLHSLKLLHEAGHISRRAAGELALAYQFLRQVEHRLQMVADQQTHSLPESEAELKQFALFMGYKNAEPFARHLLRHLSRVRNRFTRFFRQPDGPVSATAITADQPVEHPESLMALGYRNPTHVLDLLKHWRAGSVRALRSDRARELLNAMIPTLLTALAKQSANPDQALARFDQLLTRLPAGVQLLSLLAHNQVLLERIATVLNASPKLADHLAQSPAALEGLLAPQDMHPDPYAVMTGLLRDTVTLEETIAIIRDFVRGEEFRLSVLTLEGALDIDRSGPARTLLADATIRLLLAKVSTLYQERHGPLPGGGLAVVALGKAGGQDMMAGSDLDLMLIYDHVDADGDVPTSTSQYYIRLAHHFVAALTAPGVDGPLYAVDMRLRPSGNKGPVAISLASFVAYHQSTARTWERMALIRARVIEGPTKLTDAIERAIIAAIGGVTDQAMVKHDACTMRTRLLRDMPAKSHWDIRLRTGGLLEVEFIAQTLQLTCPMPSATEMPRRHRTRDILRGLGDAGALQEGDVAVLLNADKIWRNVQAVLRIALGSVPQGAPPIPALQALLLNLPQDAALTEATLDDWLGETGERVRRLFARLIGDPVT